MSTALALAAVTASLREVLNRGFAELQLANVVGGNIDVTATPPDRIELNAANANNRVNVYLYHVTRNTGWWNEGLPSRNARGERIGSPALAVDLRYLVTAYGVRDFHGEILLGHAMQLLHETPVLTRDTIRKALNPQPAPVNFPQALANSQLPSQIEQIKIAHDPINTEEVSRLWTAFNVHYRPSAAYQVSVVLIEADRARQAALPVAARNAYAQPFRPPRIDTVEVADAPGAPILPDSVLSVQGVRLGATKVLVRVNGIDLSPAITAQRDDEILLTLTLPQPQPPALWPPGLHAGMATLQIVHPVSMGTPPADHDGPATNVAAFLLRPTIAAKTLPGAVGSQFNGQAVKSGRIEASFAPKVGIAQRVVLLLNQRNPPANREARAYSFAAPENNGLDPSVATETDKIVIAYRRVVPGEYLVRAQVDGAESPLELGAATGRYDKPFVTV